MICIWAKINEELELDGYTEKGRRRRSGGWGSEEGRREGGTGRLRLRLREETRQAYS